MTDRYLRYFGCDLGIEQQWLADYWGAYKKALLATGIDIGWYYENGVRHFCISAAESIEIKPVGEDFSQTFYAGAASGEWRERLSRFITSLGLPPDTEIKWGVVYLDRGRRG